MTSYPVFDQRWVGPHGIGRFALETRSRLKGFQDLDLRGRPASAVDPLQLGMALRRIRPLAYVSPGFNVPLAAPCPVIITIHDLIPVTCSESRSVSRSIYFKLLQRPAVRTAPITFTVSEFSKQELVQLCEVDPSRVVVVGNGISDAFRSEGLVQQNSRPYFLCVGNSKPHKNIPFLIKAFAAISRRHDCDLFIVCHPSKELTKLVQGLGIVDRIVWLKNLSDEELASYYRGALGLVMPSLYEGFGLPIVESMACGCPVISSDRTSLPEIAKDCAQYFNPTAKDELVDLMTCYVTSNQRVIWAEKGIRRASIFSWNRVAKAMSDALTSCGILQTQN